MMTVSTRDKAYTGHIKTVNSLLKEAIELPKQTPSFLGALKVGQEIIQKHTDYLVINWKDRVSKFETSHPDRKFIVKHVKRNIVVKRLK